MPLHEKQMQIFAKFESVTQVFLFDPPNAPYLSHRMPHTPNDQEKQMQSTKCKYLRVAPVNGK